MDLPAHRIEALALIAGRTPPPESQTKRAEQASPARFLFSIYEAVQRDSRMIPVPFVLDSRTTWLPPLTEIEILPDVSNSGL